VAYPASLKIWSWKKLLAIHDKNILAFTTALAAVTDSDEKNFGLINVLNSAEWRLSAQAV